MTEIELKQSFKWQKRTERKWGMSDSFLFYLQDIDKHRTTMAVNVAKRTCQKVLNIN